MGVQRYATGGALEVCMRAVNVRQWHRRTPTIISPASASCSVEMRSALAAMRHGAGYLSGRRCTDAPTCSEERFRCAECLRLR
jgi:hypothetical protein